MYSLNILHKEKSDKYCLRDDSVESHPPRSMCPIPHRDFVKELGYLIEVFTDREVVIEHPNIQDFCFIDRNLELIKSSNVISLDKYYSGHYNLNISRIFRHDDQISAESFRVANESDFINYLRRTTHDRFLLVDDDICSGMTITRVCQIIETIWPSASITAASLCEYEYYDIVDARDFIPGSIHGGLLVSYGPGTLLQRKIYMHPEVDLVHRMKLPSQEAAIIFTESLKKLHSKYGILY